MTIKNWFLFIMDITTLIGVVSGIGLIAITIIMQGNPKVFFNVGSILIVFGGTFAATLINYPLKEVLSVMGVVKNVFTHKVPESVETIKQIVKLADLARREGILALEREMSGIEDDFLRQGMQLAVDGTEPALIMDMMETWRKSLMHEHEVKYQKVIEGIMAIQAGDNPRIIEHKLSVIY